VQPPARTLNPILSAFFSLTRSTSSHNNIVTSSRAVFHHTGEKSMTDSSLVPRYNYDEFIPAKFNP